MIAKKLPVILILLIIFSSFAFAELNNQYDTSPTQLNRGNHGSDFETIKNLNIENVEVFNTIQNYDDIKVCDYDSDGINELLIYDAVNDRNKIYVLNALDSNLRIENIIELDSDRIIEEILCVQRESDMRVIIVSKTSTNFIVEEYDIASNNLILAYEYFDVANLNLLPINEITCSDYDDGGFIDAYGDWVSYTSYWCQYTPIDTSYSAIGFGLVGGNVKFGYKVDIGGNNPARPYTYQKIDLGDEYDEFTTTTKNLLFNKQNFNIYIQYSSGGLTGSFYGGANACVNSPNQNDDVPECIVNSTSSPAPTTYTIPSMIASGQQKLLNDGNVCGFGHSSSDSFAYCIGSTDKYFTGGNNVSSDVSFSEPFMLDMIGDNGLDGVQEICGALVRDNDLNFRSMSCINRINQSKTMWTSYNSSQLHIPVNAGYTSNDEVVLMYDSMNNYLISIDGGRSGYEGDDTTNIIYEFSGDFQSAWSKHIKYADITGDGFGEIILKDTQGYTYVMHNSIVEPRDFTIYGTGVYGYYNPSCEGENVTFYMRECRNTLDCTYEHTGTDTNDFFSEREQICTTCGGTQNLHCGDYALTTPNVYCDNLSIGNHTIDFYLYSDIAPNTLAHIVENVPIEIHNGTDGLNCNQIVVETSVVDGVDETTNETIIPLIPSDDDTTTDGNYDDPDDLISSLFSGVSTLWQIVLGMMIVLGVTISVAQYNKNMPPFVIGLVAVLATILVTALGLFPAYILILIIIIAVVGIVLAKMTGGD